MANIIAVGYFLSEPFCFLLNRTVLLFLKLGRSCFFSNWDGPAFSQTGTVLAFLKLGRSWLFSNWDGPAFLKLGRSWLFSNARTVPIITYYLLSQICIFFIIIKLFQISNSFLMYSIF